MKELDATIQSLKDFHDHLNGTRPNPVVYPEKIWVYLIGLTIGQLTEAKELMDKELARKYESGYTQGWIEGQESMQVRGDV